jgi:16S rRNA (adenine1518-N6/adenine1519-N6)-dimethyltransferase
MDIKKQLKISGIQPNKLMGQNFLISETALRKIIDEAELDKHAVVLEVGPGLGILTAEMAKRSKKVIAVEKDPRLALALEKILKEKKIKNVEIIIGDILKIFPEINSKFKSINLKYKVVANIPYYLTSRLLRTLLESESRPQEIILTVQKEVAERITARPPRMNLLGFSVQSYGKPKIAAIIPASAFWPKPKIDSAIIKISEISKKFFIENNLREENFFKILKIIFSQPRKIILNPLKRLGVPKTEAEEMLKKCGINPRARAGELGADKIVCLVGGAKMKI